MELPLFPLKTVLLPGNKLSLKIFEPRYIDMIADCMREDKPFGIVLIYKGMETDRKVEIFGIGTTARVNDWQNRDDGLLGISVLGEQRFRINATRNEHNGLIVADAELLEDEEEEQPVPHQFYYMSELLRHLTSSRNELQPEMNFRLTLYQLIYLLPLESVLKQQLLEVPGCQERAMVLHAELIRLGIIQYVKP